MARGYIYVLVNSSLPGLVKVGKTTRVPSERVTELSGVTGVPTPFIVAFEQIFADCDSAEDYVHAHLERRGLRQTPNREFFRAETADVIRIIMSAPGAISGNTQPMLDVEDDGDIATDCNSSKPWAALLDEAYNFESGTNGYLEDHAEAYKLFREAARLGCAEAYVGLGRLHRFGLGVRLDLDEALKNFKEAAKRDYCYAFVNMMELYAKVKHEKNFHSCIEKYIEHRASSLEQDHEVWWSHPQALSMYIWLALESGWRPNLLEEIRSIAAEIRRFYDEQRGQNERGDKTAELIKSNRELIVLGWLRLHRL